jgi:hypothetical protein
VAAKPAKEKTMAEKKPSNYDEVVDEKTRKKANKAYEDASKIGPDKGAKPTPPKEQMMHRYEESTGFKPASVGMAKGGSASSRADGIASKGKTRGKMC